MSEYAYHADGTRCTRATTTHDCPLSHDYERVEREFIGQAVCTWRQCPSAPHAHRHNVYRSAE